MGKSGAEIVYLRQYEEEFAPPAQPVLGVSVVGDEVFLYITQYDETAKTATYTTLAQAAVRLDDLLLALEAAVGGHLQTNPTTVIINKQAAQEP